MHFNWRLSGVSVILLILAGLSRLEAIEPEDISTQYTITSWTEKDGIASSSIRVVAQDHDGYLWLATHSGLVRFDGIRLVQWTPRDGSRLPSDDLFALRIARDRSIWIGHGGIGGVTRIRNGELSHFRPSPDGLFDSFVFALLEDRTGAVWAGGLGGLARFDGNRWERIGDLRNLPDQSVFSLYEDHAGTLWVGTAAGVFRRSATDAVFEPVTALAFRVDDFSGDVDPRLFVTHPRLGFQMIDVHTRAAAGVGAPNDLRGARRLLRDRQGDLWIGTRGQGVFRVRHAGGSRAMTIEHLGTDDGLSANSVGSMFEDREGNIWIGTSFGLNRLSKNSIIPVDSVKGELRAVAAARDGTIWAATLEGLFHLTDHGQTEYGPKAGLVGRSINALYSDPETNALWVSSEEGLFRFQNGRFESLTSAGGGGPNRIRSITIDREERLWLCDPLRGVLRSRDSSLSAFDVISPSDVGSVYSDREGRVWLGFASGDVGLYMDGVLRVFSATDGLASGGTTSVIHEDQTGTIWIGSHKGLSRYANGRFMTIDHTNGFPRRGPVAIADDDYGFLWLGVNGVGIVRLSRAEVNRAMADRSHRLQYQVYDTSDGLRATPIRPLATPTTARGRDGAMWFVTGNGLAVVKPTELREVKYPLPLLLVERIVADDDEYETHARPDLPPLVSQLQIDYTLLQLAPSRHVNFRYMLEGLDHQWVDAGTRRQAFYTNVPPGHYRFRVAANNDGIWSESDRAIEFSIRRKFYQTGWFALICAMALALVIWQLWRFRMRQIQTRFAIVLDERGRIGREIHDTLLQGLVGVAVQIKVISDKIDSSPALAVARLERLRKQVEQYICETRESIWDLRSPQLHLRDLATALRQAAAAVMADQPAAFELVVTGKPHPCDCRVEEHLLRVGREALSNAVRHAAPTRVRVDLIYGPDTVRLRVVDDGCGFNLEDPRIGAGGHWGLTSMRERAQTVNGHLNVITAPGRGTQVDLVVPVVA